MEWDIMEDGSAGYWSEEYKSGQYRNMEKTPLDEDRSSNFSTMDITLPAADIMPQYLTQTRNYVFNVTILIVLTYGGDRPTDLWKNGGALELAVKMVRQNILPDVYVRYYFVSRPNFVDCYEEENHAAYIMTKFALRDAKMMGFPPVGLVVGPACTKAMESLGRLTADMEVPIVSSQAFSLIFDDKNIFKTITRTGVTMKSLSSFLMLFLDQYNYTNVAMIYDDVSRFFTVVGAEFYRKLYFRPDVRMTAANIPYRTDPDFAGLLYQASNNSRVIMILAPGDAVRKFMLTAYDLKMTNGDYKPLNRFAFGADLAGDRVFCLPGTGPLSVFYMGQPNIIKVFITSEWYREKYWGSYDWKRKDERDSDAKTAFKSLFIIKEALPASDPSDDLTPFTRFQEEAKQLAWSRFGYGYDADEQVSPAVTEMYDGIILWATAINETLAQKFDPRDGLKTSRLMWNRKLKGVNGTISIDQNGDRDAGYFMLQMDLVTDRFSPVLYYEGAGRGLRYLRDISWFNRLTSPPNEPECGYQNEKLICYLRNDKTNVIIGAVAAGAAFLIICAGVGFLIYRKQKMEQALRSTWWRVNFDEVRYHVRAAASSRRSVNKLDMEGEADENIALASYHDGPVIVRGLKHKIDVNRDFLIYLTKLHNLTHENLSRVVGICPEPNREALLTEFCSKGRLIDLLANEDVELDWGFQSSLITDLVAGLGYLHSSFVASHGNLDSHDCVVDSRFTLKITDYVFPQYREMLLLPLDAPNLDIDYGALLWRAPELLRQGMPSPSGTPKGDVFSMAIILSEIATRREPYSTADPMLPDFTAAEIVHQVRKAGNPPFRPLLLPAECPIPVADIVRKCWADSPNERPKVTEAQSLLKENGVAKGSVMDNIIKRMEEYAGNLEATVGDRTKALMDEKRKVEEILYELLPRPVADALKIGRQVAPEAFEMVTIYYSDIVGFTTLSAKSTAFQVVDLLNDLYTMFDGIIAKFDAYKVETIGDAYIMASGVPVRNGNQHASEIARLSLRFRDKVAEFKMRHLPHDQMKLRIGLHSGYCAAGVVGVKMPRYCLFGESVQMANKMESTGQAAKIQISEVTKRLLDQSDEFVTEFRHALELPNQITLMTFWLLGEKSTVPSQAPVAARTVQPNNMDVPDILLPLLNM